jgi:hypothetical protein
MNECLSIFDLIGIVIASINLIAFFVVVIILIIDYLNGKKK